jgi:hypothetical protein
MTYEKELQRQVSVIASMLHNFCSEVDRAYKMPNKKEREQGVTCNLDVLKAAAESLSAVESKVAQLRSCIEDDDDMKKAVA